MIRIGIDPGVKTGFAVSVDGDIVDVKTLSIMEAQSKVLDYMYRTDKNDLELHIEDPRQNKPVFDKGVNGQRKNLKIAQNVGSNKRDAAIWEEFCKYYDIDYILVRPQTSKWPVKYFQMVTKYEGRTSEHGRDAAKLIVGIR